MRKNKLFCMAPLALTILYALLFPCSAQATATPSVSYIKVNGTTVSAGGTITLSDFSLGDTFTVKVYVWNDGSSDSPNDYNNITLSFSQFTSSSDKSRVWPSDKSTNMSNPVDYYGSEALGGDAYANYVMTESYSSDDQWDGWDYLLNESEWIELVVQPKSLGNFYVYYRAGMSYLESWTSGWSYDPSSSSYTDCLSFPAYRIKVVLVAPNNAPNTPDNEDPYNGENNVSQTTDLDWSCSDPDGDTIYYTVYFEKDDSTPNDIIKNDSTGSSANPGTLDYDSHYYWQVQADDHNGGVTWSPVWDFYTESGPLIVSAYWWAPLTVTEGAVATMCAEVEGFSIGDQFTFEVYEDDPFFDDYITTVYGNVYQSGGKYYVKAEWTTVWNDDEGTPPPEFYFKVYRESVSANSPGDLVVNQATYTVSATAGTGGSVSPSSRSGVAQGSTTTFTVSPATGYSIGSVSGDAAGGSWSSNTYTTAAVTQNRTITFSFVLNTYTVSATAGTGGSVSPSSRSVTYGNTTTFTVSPVTGYSIGSVSGDAAGGSWSGNTYTTAAVTQNRTLSFSFVGWPDLIVESVWAEPASPIPGQAYVIKATVKNQGPVEANPWGWDCIEAMFWVGGASPVSESDFCYSIAAGASYTFTSYSMTAPTAGVYIVKVKGDCNESLGSDVDESDESNNEKSFTMTIQPPKGSLNVTVKNQDGTLISGATVIRYPDPWGAEIDNKTTDGSGVVSWTNIDAVTYNLEAYYNGEYWCSGSATVPTGSTKSTTLQRNEPYANDFKVYDAAKDTEITGGSIAQGKMVRVDVPVINSSPNDRTVKVTVWLDRNQDGTADHTLDLGNQTVTKNGGTKTFTALITPDNQAAYYRKLEVQTSVDGTYTKTDSWPYGGPAFTVVASTAPQATFVGGMPTTMQPGKRYSVTADYTDPNGAADLSGLYLCLTNAASSKVLALYYSMVLGMGDSGVVDGGQEYITLTDAQETTIANGYQVTWTFFLTGKWSETPNGVGFGVAAMDQGGEACGWNFSGTSTKFEVPSLPAGKWTVFVHGKTTDGHHLVYQEGGVVSTEVASWLAGDEPTEWDQWATIHTANYTNITSDTGFAWKLADKLRSLNGTPTPTFIHRMQHASMQMETWSDTSGEYLQNSDHLDTSAHHILIFDWDKPSGYVEPDSGKDDWYSYAAGDALYAWLCTNGLQSKVSCLIAHSRGATVCSETARRLVQNGSNGFQVLYLDGEGWGHGVDITFPVSLKAEGFQDSAFHGWLGTRTDQYRQLSTTDKTYYNDLLDLGADYLNLGAEGLDQGNDRIVEYWPAGTYLGGSMNVGGERADHMVFPEYLTEWCYLTNDSRIGGVCVETPQMWQDDTGPHTSLAYPTQQASESPHASNGFYNGSFDGGSCAGWLYHGGEITDDGIACIAASECLISDENYALWLNKWWNATSYQHNWQVVPSNSTHVSFSYDLGNWFSSSGQLRLLWGEQVIGYVPFGSGTDWETTSFNFNYPVGSVDRLKVEIVDTPWDAGAFVDDISFEINTVPTISALVPSSSSLVQGLNLTLTAQQVTDTDGSIELVEFYHDVGGLWQLVGDNSVVNGGNCSVTISSSGFSTGTHQFMAKAKDDKGGWSAEKTCTVAITASANNPPQIGAFSDSPDPVDCGNSVSLICSNVTDQDSGQTVTNVAFYRDNGDGYFDAATDLKLANAAQSGSTWSKAISTSGFPIGNVRYWAIAYDSLGLCSAATSSVGTVRQYWTLAYQVKPNSSAGTITQNPAAGSYENGTVVNPSGTPANSNWYLCRWEMNNQAGSVPFAMTQSVTVAACFSQIVYQTAAPVIADIGDQAIAVGSAYSYSPTLTQGYPVPTWCFVGSPPSGMTINTSEGIVTWSNPTPAGQSFSITIRATNSVGYDDESWNLLVGSGGVVDQPQFSPDQGSYPDSLDVTITCATTGATIRYTTDYRDPTTNDTIITSGGKVRVDRSMTLKAKAWKTDWIESLIKSGTYTIAEPRISIISPTNGQGFFTSNVPITALASDSDGLSEVHFYNGTNWLGTTNLPAGTLTWSNTFLGTNLPIGTNTLTARAWDVLNNVTTSLTVSITVTNTIQFNVSSTSVNETAGSVTLTVMMAGGSSGAASVNYATANGTASAGADYTTASGTLTWADGNSDNKTITIPILNRSGTQGSRTFTVTLSSASGASLGTTYQTTVTINDVGSAGTLQFSASSASVNEDAGSVTLTVTRTDGISGAASVYYCYENNTAVAGTDYTAVSETLTWSDGNSDNKTITIPILNRSGTQGSRTFAVFLSSASGASLGSTVTATVTIKDADTTPSAPTGVRASEGEYTDKVRVSWSAVSGATSYEVWRFVFDSTSFASTLSENVAETSYDDTSAEAGVTYYYWVKAKNSIGTSDFSGSDTGWRQYPIPDPPTGVSASDGQSKLSVTWNGVSGSGTYEVWRNTINDASSARCLGEVISLLSSYDDTSATLETTYYYWVKAKNDTGASGFSDSDSGWRAWAVSGDYDGDMTKDLAVYGSVGSDWYIYSLTRHVTLVFGDTWGSGQAVAISGDYDGDGVADMTVYDETTGRWYIRTVGGSVIANGMLFGAAGYAPVFGDFDGDGKTDLAVYQESTGYWYILLSGSGYSLSYMKFGASGYTPVPSDYDGDGLSDIAVYHEDSGYWYILLSGSSYSLSYMKFGASGYTPVSGDFDADGKIDLAVYQESTGYWYILKSTDYSLAYMQFGASGYTPVPGDYDGDGTSDLTVYQESSGYWYILLSGSGYSLSYQKFGAPGYTPVQ